MKEKHTKQLREQIARVIEETRKENLLKSVNNSGTQKEIATMNELSEEEEQVLLAVIKRVEVA